MKLYDKIKCFFDKFEFLRIYFSPFKPFIPKFYIGKISIGTPYFFPRRIIGFDFVCLGWKTKFEDFRHEWDPRWSFVIFGFQVALIFEPKHNCHYWECWLNYRNTDKNKSVKERIKDARKSYKCVWSVGYMNKRVCYWDKVLKRKYLEN